MKTYFYISIIFLASFHRSIAQNKPIGREVTINLPTLVSQLQANATATNEAYLPIIEFPMPGEQTLPFRVKESPVFDTPVKDTKTYSGQSLNNKAKIRFSITPTGGLEAIIHTESGYYIIEPIDKKAGKYRFYAMNEAPSGDCNTDSEAKAFGNVPPKNGRILNIYPFPVGSQLRIYRMAAAATGEMVTAFEGTNQARDKIVAILNATNLIYEIEASVRFALISKTTDFPYPLLFTNGATDPFPVDSNFAGAYNSQIGFNTLNNNATLPYNQYDIAHTFNSYSYSNSATWARFYPPSYYIRGQAGGRPCDNSTKAVGWTEFEKSAYLGSIVNIFAHEVSHQFSAGHTFNAIGGANDFCTSQWDGSSAIEPGGGSTLLGYNSNCGWPVNYTLRSNFDSYFHTKSLEQIYNAVNTTSTCYTPVATGNTPPVANAGADVTIPKGTPFVLTGTATDPDINDQLTYAWDQYDVASAGDKGAFGSDIVGVGGYTAVNSTESAPLFKSKLLNVPSRTFPSLEFILIDANNPWDPEGEDLPLKPRKMKFRFTVRDNHTTGGGVDSDEAIVNVAESGPFLITSHNLPTTWYTDGTTTTTVLWSVNNTQLSPVSCNNVKISLSTDGGNTFPIVLAANTLNDGAQTVTIPNLSTTTGRIKVEAIGNIFFDINNVDITITNTCSPVTYTLAPSNAVTAPAGSPALNLSLAPTGPAITRFVIVNTATDIIIAIQNTPNLSNSAIFTAGTYAIHGFSSAEINYDNYVGISFSTFAGLLPSTVCGRLSSNSVAVTIQPCSTLPPSVSSDLSICSGDSAALTATGCAGTINWTAIPARSPLPSGSTGKVAPTETTTYYATCSNNGCASTAVSLTITVNPLPDPPTSVTGANIARGNTATLTTGGCSGGTTVHWLASPTSNQALGTGTSFTTPPLAGATDFYVACFNGTCHSARLLTKVTVSNPCLAVASTFQPAAPVTAVVGNAALALNLVAYTAPITKFSGTITFTDPVTSLVFSLDNNCQLGGNPTNYDAYKLHVTVGGTYSFNISGPQGVLANIYSGSFDPNNLCQGWIQSTTTSQSMGSMTVTLTANTLYTLVVTGFGSNYPVYPATYSINFVKPNGALIYEVLPAPVSNYNYTYVISNNTTGRIVGFSSDANLTNSSLYGVGQYTVRGLSYEVGPFTNLNPYINTDFAVFQAQFPLPNCGVFSSTSKSVNIMPNCALTLDLNGNSTPGTQQAWQNITSTQNINSGTAVTYRAGSSIILLPAEGSGFTANNGSVFKAEIAGCN
ncbi:3-coathanger stack domain-containing protein [Runella sp.]|uniref:Ig-like domain-containing protein n=1 Tax=Runella sp. TaxID=1960881 RepID=UPI003D0CE308